MAAPASVEPRMSTAIAGLKRGGRQAEPQESAGAFISSLYPTQAHGPSKLETTGRRRGRCSGMTPRPCLGLSLQRLVVEGQIVLLAVDEALLRLRRWRRPSS